MRGLSASPQPTLRNVYAVSDVHAEYRENMQWCEELSDSHTNDVLIVAGEHLSALTPALAQALALASPVLAPALAPTPALALVLSRCQPRPWAPRRRCRQPRRLRSGDVAAAPQVRRGLLGARQPRVLAAARRQRGRRLAREVGAARGAVRPHLHCTCTGCARAMHWLCTIHCLCTASALPGHWLCTACLPTAATGWASSPRRSACSCVAAVRCACAPCSPCTTRPSTPSPTSRA
jgi:hypothetical protein